MKNNIWDINLNYESINNEATCFSSGSLIHPYPAKAMPNMVNDLLNIFKTQYGVKSVLDPFCGSGTVGLESKLLGIDFFGSDLNPLAILIAKTKTLNIENKSSIYENIDIWLNKITNTSFPKFPIVDFPNIKYWFKEKNIVEISYIKYEIDKFLSSRNRNQELYALVILTAFSSTIREVCLSRNGEFKLYRIPEAKIETWNISACSVFREKIDLLFNLLKEVNSYSLKTKIEIRQANAKNLSHLADKQIDSILTSPPYGDSSSTVAYGQFSRLPTQWLADLFKKYLRIQIEKDNCDEILLGGKKSCNQYDKLYANKMLAESKSLQNLFVNIDKVTQVEINNINSILGDLTNLAFDMNHNPIKNNKILLNKLKSFLKKRIEKYRVFSKEKYLIEVDKYLNFKNISKNKVYRRIQLISKLIQSSISSHKNKLQQLPKRKDDVLFFFIDLYLVFLETDRILRDGGIQGWIIGNRTVLGSVKVPLSDILSDWFEAHSYKKITSLTRRYSFKRLPHHMNSSLDRDKKISSMMEEHIIVYKKQ